MEKGFWKLLQNFDLDPTVGPKVISLSNHYSGLGRTDLRLTEYEFHIHSKEKALRKHL
jgi:hypothetical protein